jgi:hypothetical protein
MEVEIDYEILPGANNEPIVKELSIATKDVVETFHFRSPYAMYPHGSEENGLHWGDGNIEYDPLHVVLGEAVANFAHLYSFGASKCKFLS